jgi:serine protease Do
MKTKRKRPRTPRVSPLFAIALLVAPFSLQAQEAEKSVVRRAEEPLVTTGKVSRGRIGVRVMTMTAALAESFSLDRPRGVMVAAVEPGQPAEKAGIRPGDIILSVGGRPAENEVTLPSMVAAIRPGTKTELEIWSDRKLRKVTVTVAGMTEGEASPAH